MTSLTESIWRLEPPYGLFSMTVVENLYPELTPGARKALIHRAAKNHEIEQLKPGLYCLAEPYRTLSPHPFCVSAILLVPSYVSLESALGHHNLIPEAVQTTSCCTSLRSRDYDTPLGFFSFKRIHCNNLLSGARSVQLAEDAWAYVALPLKAIADLVYLRTKTTWKNHGPDFLTDSLRIEKSDLAQTLKFFDEVYSNTQNNRVRAFLKGMKKEFG